MTRIISGRLGGRRLATPKGDATRPTSERVREAVFSRIEALMDLKEVLVLDLYAGSGALGLEAVSRGAGRAVLVEADRRTAGVIRDNVTALGLGEVASVQADKVDRVLERGPAGASSPEGFDLVLLDPPYPVGEEDLTATLGLLVMQGWLSADALVVVERSVRSPEPTWPDGLALIRSRSYGETAVHYAEPVEESDEPAAETPDAAGRLEPDA